MYDKNGNRTSSTREGVTSTHSVDDNDKLLSGDGFTFSSYSSDGNPGSVTVPGTGSVSFVYDYENRSTSTVLPSRTNTFKYNADGQRVEQVSSQGTRRYVYDGSTIIAETDGAGTILTYFLHGVGYISGTTQHYYRENALGSNISGVSATGVFESQTEFDAYGVEGYLNQGPWSQFRFAGKHGYQTDLDTGLDLLGNRYYMPMLGRFLTQDPIGHEAGLNLYAYAENNPTKNIDPDGLDVTAIFDRRRGTLTVTDNQHRNRTVTIRGVFSGYGNSSNNPADEGLTDVGPIPAGTYILDTKSFHETMGWRYQIFVPDGHGSYRYDIGEIRVPGRRAPIRRGGFNLHAGRISDGCVTVYSSVEFGQPGYPNSSDYQRVRNIIDGTRTTRFNYTDSARRNQQIPGRFAGKLIVR